MNLLKLLSVMYIVLMLTGCAKRGDLTNANSSLESIKENHQINEEMFIGLN